MNFDRHFYLYAKGHYKKYDLVADLKILVGLRCGLDEKYVSELDIISILSFILCDKVSLDKFIRQLIDVENLYPQYHYTEKLIRAFLYFLTFADVKDIPFELGEADSQVLPLK